MSCKSAIYTVNNGLQTVAAGAVIPAGTVIRRFGCNVQQSGSGITVEGGGYYEVNVSVTASPTVIGTATVSLLQDGAVVPGASGAATVTAANDTVNISFPAIIRLQCCNSTSTLTLVLSGVPALINNAAVTVTKI